MYKAIWKFRVSANMRAQFEEVYGPAGKWVQLFSKAPGYLGTELLCDVEDGCYITIDSWKSKLDFESFKDRWEYEYSELDRQCECLTQEETRIGTFVSV